MKDLWYRNTIIYSVDVKTFMDGNGDGVGDFRGLIKRLDHLAGLGITCIWLRPFYPSPDADNGYDISDYYNVDPKLGTLGDFVELLNQAKNFGIRIIVDLVVNHTSTEHSWFQEARTDKNSRYRDYYIWSKEEPETPPDKIVFKGDQETIWTFDEKAGEYYLHRYKPEQPDLNIANNDVREEIFRIMGFWLQLGVAGFRIDSAHIIVEPTGLDGLEAGDLHSFMNQMRSFTTNHRGDAVMIAEANVAPEKLTEYFGENNRMHMLISFLTNKNLFLALARKNARPLRDIIKQLKEISPAEEWLNFVRHHDELNLELLTDKEREDVFAAFAPDEDMQLYGHGIRRRLPPMLNGDQRRIRLTYSLLFSLPGVPMLNCGEEIGMGEDLSLDKRMSIRTPMQWSSGRNAGFSTADSRKLIRPVISHGAFSFTKVNVADQLSDPGSLLNWMARLINVRKRCPALGWGSSVLLETNNPGVLAFCSEWEDNLVFVIHNLTDKACTIEVDSTQLKPQQLTELFADKVYDKLQDESLRIPLEAYGYRWFTADRSS